MNRPEAQNIQAGEPEATGGDAAAVRSDARRLISDCCSERDRPEAHGDTFVRRQIRIATELIPLISEDISKVVQLVKSRHVTHVAREVVFSSECRNRVRGKNEHASFV